MRLGVQSRNDWVCAIIHLNISANKARAILTISDARAHLQHFCATLPRNEGCSVPVPIFLTDGIPGPQTQVSCRVVLPPSLPSSLQSVVSRSQWRSEKMAKKDAAFHACVLLHQSGLVTDNLLPPVPEKADRSIEGRDSMYEVRPLLDPWRSTRKSLASSCSLYAHRLSIRGCEELLPNLQLLLPMPLRQDHETVLYVSPSATVTASLSHCCGQYEGEKNLAVEATKLLYGAVLSRRLPGIERDDYALPHYLVPDIPPRELVFWIRDAWKSSLVSDYDFNQNPRPSYVIRKQRETIPYFYTAPELPFRIGEKIEVVRLSRQIDLLKARSEQMPDQRLLEVDEDCTVSGLQSGYVRITSFMPSILHGVEVKLRAYASSPLLKTIKFKDERLLAAALTSPDAGTDNYQRLEYLGDSLLKCLAVVNLFCLYPQAPESQLTLRYHRLTNNGRLQRVTRDLGLEVFFSHQHFSAHEWTLTEKPEPSVPRILSSKVLGDVIEALIGAAYVDGGEANALKALDLFLTELSWHPPAAAVARLDLDITNPPDSINLDKLCEVEALIRYSFKQKALLLEALTHPSVQSGGLRSYERLEFLGDAIIDFIVNEKLWFSPLDMTEGQMTERKASLVNKEIMAYLTTKLATEVELNDVRVNPHTGKTSIQASTKRICLHDYLSMMPSQALHERRQSFMKRHEAVKDSLEERLKHGEVFPWSDLYHLNSPKFCSDVLESIIGAVYIDSGAVLENCEMVLRKMGLMELVDRAAAERDVAYTRPLVRLRVKVDAARSSLRVERKRRTGGTEVNGVFDCRLMLNGEEAGRNVGASCPAEAEDRAAEIVLEKIESGGVDDEAEEDGERSGC